MDKKEKEIIDNSQEVKEAAAQIQTEKIQDGIDEVVTEESEAEKEDTKAVDERFELAKQEAEEWKDKFLRLSAEFDNYRKRTLREKQELVAVASEGTLLKILPVIDDFERALQNNTSTADIESIRTGMELIYKLLLRFLQECGVTEIEALDQELNTDYHDAITQFPVEDESKRGRVVDVLRKGYLLNGRVLRHAQVVVGE
ncbi:MAG: nucleotide exchange factor GrpE [Bacteroides sp.]